MLYGDKLENILHNELGMSWVYGQLVPRIVCGGESSSNCFEADQTSFLIFLIQVNWLEVMTLKKTKSWFMQWKHFFLLLQKKPKSCHRQGKISGMQRVLCSLTTSRKEKNINGEYWGRCKRNSKQYDGENWQWVSCFFRTMPLHRSMLFQLLLCVTGFELADHLPYSPEFAQCVHCKGDYVEK